MSFAPGILEGKTAVVTGGATGIGSYIARMLGTLGAKVGIVSRKEENLKAAVEACLLYTSPSPRDATLSRMPSSA